MWVWSSDVARIRFEPDSLLPGFWCLCCWKWRSCMHAHLMPMIWDAWTQKVPRLPKAIQSYITSRAPHRSLHQTNKKKIQPPCKHSMLWHVVTMFQAPLVFIVASWGQLRLVAPGVLPFGLRTVLLHTRSILLSSRLDSFAVQLHFPHLLACFLKNLLLIHARCIPTVLDQVLRSGPVPL